MGYYKDGSLADYAGTFSEKKMQILIAKIVLGLERIHANKVIHRVCFAIVVSLNRI